jgi:hypothetical protein
MEYSSSNPMEGPRVRREHPVSTPNVRREYPSSTPRSGTGGCSLGTRRRTSRPRAPGTDRRTLAGVAASGDGPKWESAVSGDDSKWESAVSGNRPKWESAVSGNQGVSGNGSKWGRS